MNELLKQLQAWALSFDNDFDAFVRRLESKIKTAQAALLRRIIADVLPNIAQKDGKFASGIANIAKANLIRRAVLQSAKDDIVPLVVEFADKALTITGRNAEYYILSGADAKKVQAIVESSKVLQTVLGIGENGQLLKDGYLYRLANTDLVEEQLRQYLITSIATRQDVGQFQKGLKELIVGNKDVDGALVKYFRQYAFDTYSRIREVDNLHFADELELNYFVYTGGVIKTSRDFCIKKNGKVFSREEAQEQWPKDPDLIDRTHVASYRPLIDRGRYNCRHFLMWISDEKAKEMKNEQ